MLAVSLSAKGSIVFSSEAALKEAIKPLSIEEVVSNSAIEIRYSESLKEKKVVPLRNPGTGNLLKTPVYSTKLLTVFYPETPRVPHHLTIALNRKGVKGIIDVSEEENKELFETVNKIAEIYKAVAIKGFVIAQFDTPQEGQLGRFVVEIIPHLPGFNEVKNIVDKVDCNRYVLFRKANLSPIRYKFEDEGHAQFWQKAFQKKYPALSKSDLEITFPFSRKQSHQLEAERVLNQQLVELLEDKGGAAEGFNHFEAVMPTKVPEDLKSVTASECVFCKDGVIEKQLVYEYKDVFVFYNIRKGPKPGSLFLVLPKRHVKKVYALTPSEIHNIGLVRKALVEVLKEVHPECEVMTYIQDDPAIGQTVFHSHEQVVAVNPQTIALFWTVVSLNPKRDVSSEEIVQVREEFGLRLHQKIEAQEADLLVIGE